MFSYLCDFSNSHYSLPHYTTTPRNGGICNLLWVFLWVISPGCNANWAYLGFHFKHWKWFDLNLYPSCSGDRTSLRQWERGSLRTNNLSSPFSPFHFPTPEISPGMQPWHLHMAGFCRWECALYCKDYLLRKEPSPFRFRDMTRMPKWTSVMIFFHIFSLNTQYVISFHA